MPNRLFAFGSRACWLARMFLCLLVLAVGVASGACGPKETELAFETIDHHNSGSGYSDVNPGIRVVASSEEAPAVEALLRPRLEAQMRYDELRSLNYKEWFGLAVFQGAFRTPDYAIVIERIARRGNTVNVYARFVEPSPGDNVRPSLASPYHLVRVRKEGKWDEVITFNLMRGRTVVVSVRHYVQ